MTIPTFTEFTLPVLEARYRASRDLPPSSSRDLAAWEYIAALETALHGSVRGAA